MKIIDVITSRLLLEFPESSGNFPKILNFRRIHTLSMATRFWSRFSRRWALLYHLHFISTVFKGHLLTCLPKRNRLHEKQCQQVT